jgi:hypothetical protein
MFSILMYVAMAAAAPTKPVVVKPAVVKPPVCRVNASKITNPEVDKRILALQAGAKCK